MTPPRVPPGAKRIGEKKQVEENFEDDDGFEEEQPRHTKRTPPSAKGKSKTTSKDTSPNEKKSSASMVKNPKRLAGTIMLQVLGIAAFIGAMVVFYTVEVQSEPNNIRTDELVAQYHELAEEAANYQDEMKSLPSAAVAKRWIDAATTQGDSVATRQSLLISEVVELSYEGIPETHNVEGEVDPVAYTKEERAELAETARKGRINDYYRELSSVFASEDLDERGFTAGGPWYKELDIVPAKGLKWVFNASGYFTKDLQIPVSWTMFDVENEPLALVEGTYDQEKKIFTDLTASRVVGKTANEEEKS